MAMTEMALPTIVQTFRAQMTGMSGIGKSLDGVSSTIGAKLTSASTKITKYLSAPLIGFGAVAADAASKFSQNMEYIHTQAGVPQKDLASLQSGVLQLAQQVGIGPTSLSQALYHLESTFASTGISGKKAMTLLKVAGQGAAMTGATVTDVVNALDAAVVSGIKGVQTYHQAMGQLNAIVGSGDMKLQTLADAMGTGILSSSKTAGLALKTVGAALAVYGDNNIRGAKAATELRMVLGMIVSPSKIAASAMNSIGLQTTQLAKDMRKPNGLILAFRDLKQHLKEIPTGNLFATVSAATAIKALSASSVGLKAQAKTIVAQMGAPAAMSLVGLKKMGLSTQTVMAMMKKGPTATDQAYLLGRMFGGGRTSGALLTLMDQLPRMTSKYRDITKSGKNFTGDWKVQQQQFSQQMKQMDAAMKSFEVSVGLKVLPVAKQLLGVASKIFGMFGKIPKPIQHIALTATLAVAALAPMFLVGKKIFGVFSDAFGAAHKLGQLTGVFNKPLEMTRGYKKASTEMQDAMKAFTAPGRTGLVSKLGTSFKALGSKIGSAAGKVKTLVMRMLGLQAAQEAETVATDEATTAQEGFDVAADANPIGAIVTVVLLLAGAFYEAYKHITPFRDAMDAVGRWFLGVGKTVARWAIDFKNWMVDAFDWVKSHWQLIGAILLAPIAPVVAAFLLFHNQIIGFFVDIWHGIQSAWSSVTAWLEGMPKRILGYFAGAGKWLWNVGQDVIRGLWGGIKSMAHHAVDAVKSVGHDIVSGFKSVLSIFSPSRVMAKLGHTTVEGLATGINKSKSHKDATKKIAQDLLKVVNPLPKEFETIGQQISAGLAAGISSGTAGVVSAMTQQIATAISAAKTKAKIHSPSQATATEIGRPMGQGVVKGIESQRRNAEAAMEALIKQAVAAKTKNEIAIAASYGRAATAAQSKGTSVVAQVMAKWQQTTMQTAEKQLAAEKAAQAAAQARRGSPMTPDQWLAFVKQNQANERKQGLATAFIRKAWTTKSAMAADEKLVAEANARVRKYMTAALPGHSSVVIPTLSKVAGMTLAKLYKATHPQTAGYHGPGSGMVMHPGAVVVHVAKANASAEDIGNAVAQKVAETLVAHDEALQHSLVSA